MRDYITIGSVPAGEKCAQLGSEDYYSQSRAEGRALIGQLRRILGAEKGSAQFAIKGFPHDFGTYHEVVCYFDDSDEVGADYAYTAEGELPEEWDAEARAELGL